MFGSGKKEAANENSINEVDFGIDIVMQNFSINNDLLNAYIRDCFNANEVLDYRNYLVDSWQMIYAASMKYAREMKLPLKKPEFFLKNLDEIENKLLKKELHDGKNKHKPSFAAYAIANAISRTLPSRLDLMERIIPLDNEIEDSFKLAEYKLIVELSKVENIESKEV